MSQCCLNLSKLPVCRMPVVVTGATGLLGRAVLACFKSANIDVIGLGFSRAEGEIRKLDLTDSEAVGAFLAETAPECVVHCAAERRPDVIQHGDATSLNVTATETLAKLCAGADCRLVYVSTDYVFDGTEPPYAEDATSMHPLNKYGQSKLDGEKAVQKECENYAILRVPVLYGPVMTPSESASLASFDALVSQRACEIDNYNRRYPTHVADVASVLLRLSQMTQVGVFHFSASEQLTKYDQTLLMARALNLSSDHIAPKNTQGAGASRPYDCRLINTRLADLPAARKFGDLVGPLLQPFV
ncbi:MAG: hypothetical protein MHM6MM_006793 [Cercozoa sp. M6MM]